MVKFTSMNNKILLTIFIITYFSICWAQTYNPNSLPNTFQHNDNPHYWNNNVHKATDEWQQDVAYSMEVTLYDSVDVIDATKFELIYWNNSKDTLHYVYFHLYQNAFLPNSYLSSNYENNNHTTNHENNDNHNISSNNNNTIIFIINHNNNTIK